MSGFDYPKLFASAKRTLAVANFKPKHDSARNVWLEDKPIILAAAKPAGFRVLGTGKERIVTLIRIA